MLSIQLQLGPAAELDSPQTAVTQHDELMQPSYVLHCMWKKQKEQDCLVDAQMLGRDGVQHDGEVCANRDTLCLTGHMNAVRLMLHTLLPCTYC